MLSSKRHHLANLYVLVVTFCYIINKLSWNKNEIISIYISQYKRIFNIKIKYLFILLKSIYIIKIHKLYCISSVIPLFLYYFGPLFLLSIFTERR